MAGLPQGYEIRFAEQLDIPALIAADRAASELFRPTGLIPDMAIIPESVPADELSQAIENGMIIVVTDDQGPVGFAMSQIMGDVLYLDQVSVDPSHGRKGLGRLLMLHVFALAEDHKLSAVTLSTFRDLPWNGPFYRSLGFKEIPRKKLEDWMFVIEEAQAESMDVSKRCFMRRPVRRGLFRLSG
ncbi:MAG: GNAT family N-acetyltransferase [Pseudomonadota bacterium]